MNDFQHLINDRGFRQAVIAFVLLELVGAFCLIGSIRPADFFGVMSAAFAGMLCMSVPALLGIVVVGLFRYATTSKPSSRKAKHKSKEDT